jgi:hypothetical protein
MTITIGWNRIKKCEENFVSGHMLLVHSAKVIFNINEQKIRISFSIFFSSISFWIFLRCNQYNEYFVLATTVMMQGADVHDEIDAAAAVTFANRFLLLFATLLIMGEGEGCMK